MADLTTFFDSLAFFLLFRAIPALYIFALIVYLIRTSGD